MLLVSTNIRRRRAHNAFGNSGKTAVFPYISAWGDCTTAITLFATAASTVVRRYQFFPPVPIWVLSEGAYVSNRISSDWGERCKWPARRLRQQLDVLRRHSKVAPMSDRTASANQLPPPTRLQKLENAFERCRKFAINMLPICASGLIAYAAIAEVRGCWVEVATTWIG